ncbi:putative L-lactate dehydrogenase operon regulatory protein [bacterium BMS3Abin08]|nr:putative L-lactate dehydrogenase operon regulatory protein [bacterium BMS3Abin08]
MEDSFEAGKTSEEEDSRLHITIAKATHNVIWLHMMHTIFDVMQEFLNLIWQKVYPDTEDRAILLKQHRGIVDAIKNSNSRDAYERMLEHLSFAEKKTLAFLSRNSVHELLP